ncbi:molybdenum cofactor biosynthesis protein MoaE [Corynebacterium diphtheriae]|uniref:molybdenum cofactor biosynthesis protein MoaE n=1 Tax=Corynebacterium diphtheriae TaxID=1717 RepID=UPI00321A2ED7
MSHSHSSTQNLRGLVLVASTRAAAGEYEDTSGPLLRTWLQERGFSTPEPIVVADADIAAAVAKIFAQAENLPDVLLTTGGTGITSDDRTVEAVLPYIDTMLPGIAQAFWNKGLESIDTAVVSRCVAGIHADKTFVMTLPGSRGGCRDGVAVLDPLISHIMNLVSGNPTHHESQQHHHCCSHSGPDPDYVQAQVGKIIDGFITEEPLEALAHNARSQVSTDAMGAVVTFDGIVRDHDGGQRVKHLTYSAHPTAEVELHKVLAEQIKNHPDARVWAAHRVGKLQVGEAAFIVIAAAAHRQAAFSAASAIADAVKAHVPIWKEQLMADESTQWVGV